MHFEKIGHVSHFGLPQVAAIHWAVLAYASSFKRNFMHFESFTADDLTLAQIK